nr:protein takeout-like [Leptinotarsa decemlineata]
MKVILILFSSFSFAITSDFHVGKFDRCLPDDGKCLDQAIEKAIKYSCKKGIQELKIPKLDPIEIPQINIGTKANVLDVAQEYSDVKLVGYSKVAIINSRFNTKENHLVFTAVLPELKQIANYNIKGRLLVFPIFGNGKCRITQSNVTVIHTLQFENLDDGHLILKSYDVSVKPKNMKFEFENLFNGNKLLSDRIHGVVNDNWEAIWADSKKDFDEAYGRIFYGFASEFFQKIPAADVFLKFPS